jgi:hypothetical protein
MLRVLGQLDTGCTWARHVNKAQADSFRQKAQGSMQYGAVARSSFLIASHPTEPDARIAVLGKANNVKQRPALRFEIAEHIFEANGYVFNVGRVEGVEEDDETTMEEALAGPQKPREPTKQELMFELLRDALIDQLVELPPSPPPYRRETGGSSSGRPPICSRSSTSGR